MEKQYEKLQLIKFNKKEKKYECASSTCPGVMLSRKSVIRKHFINRHLLNVVRCKICWTYFKSNEDYQNHINKLHEGAKIFECDNCNQHFTHLGTKKRHQKNCSQKANHYQCQKCQKTFRNSKPFENHLLVCNGKHATSNKIFACNKCKKEFQSEQDQKNHLMEFHKILSFDCHLCDKRFLANTNLNRHFYQVHLRNKEAKKSAKCVICDVSFKGLPGLKIHHSWKHKGEQPKYKCQLCKVIFPMHHYCKAKVNDGGMKSTERSIGTNGELETHIVLKKDSKLDSNDQDQVLHVPEQGKFSQMYQCVTCKGIFQSAKNLTNHIINLHLVENEN